MRKLIIIISVIVGCFTANADSHVQPSDRETLSEVYASAYDHIKLGYPDQEIEVSYIIDDNDYIESLSDQLYGKQLRKYRTDRITPLEVSTTQQVDILRRLFADTNESIKIPKYELRFTNPKNDLIACAIYDLSENAERPTRATVFIFGFTRSGDIYIMVRIPVYLN